MSDIVTDISVYTPWIARKNADQTITITCVDSLGVAFNLSTYTFIAEVWRFGASSAFLIPTLVNGGASGIITISFTNTQLNIAASKDYFWILRTTAPTDSVWVNGLFILNSATWSGTPTSSITLTINTGTQNITATITPGGVLASSQSAVNAGTETATFVNPATLAAKVEVIAATGIDTYTATLPSGALVSGQRFMIKFTSANTGASTLNGTAIKKSVSTALVLGDILAGEIKTIVFDGTNLQIVGGGGGGGGDVVGPAVAVADDIATFDATTGKLIKDGGKKISDLQLALGFTAEDVANKDASGGYVGLTLQKINFWDAAKTFKSFLTNANAGAQTYTFPDLTGTVLLSSQAWLTIGTSTFTGPVVIDETVTGGNTLQFLTPGLGVTSVEGKGIWIANLTPAIAGVQQISGSLTLTGSGFATTPANSQLVSFQQDVLPAQGATNPTATWRLRSSINGAAYGNGITLSSTGLLTLPSVGLSISSVGTISTPGGAQMTITPSAGGGGAVNLTGTDFTHGSTLRASWVSGAVGGSSVDVSISRNTSGVLQINSGTTSSADGSLILGRLNVTQPPLTTSGGLPAILSISGAHTNLTLSTEVLAFNFNSSATVQYATGAQALLRNFLIQAPTIGYVGASVTTDQATLTLTGAPKSGANNSPVNTHGLLIQAGAVNGAGTAPASAFGLTVNAPTGGTLNYAGQALGGVFMFAACVTGYASIRLPHGTLPTTLVDGDFWTTTAGAFCRINGVTKTITLT